MKSHLLLPTNSSTDISVLMKKHNPDYTEQYKSSLWYGTQGPTVSGLPVPLGRAVAISPNATHKPGIKCKSLADAWKVFNTLKGFNSIAIPERLPYPDVLPGGVDAHTQFRVYEPALWFAWQGVPEGTEITPHGVTLQEARDWPYYDDGWLYRDSRYGPHNGRRFMDNMWYIESESGAVYLDVRIHLYTTYELSLAQGWWQECRIHAYVGHPIKYWDNGNKASMHTVTWSTTIGGVEVDCLGSYYCETPYVGPPEFPEIPVMNLWLKELQFTTL